MRMMKIAGLAAALCALHAAAASAQIRITEWMYNGATPSTNIGEFVELTNIGASPVDMTGWSFDDSSRVAGSQSLTGLGMVAPLESVILTDMTAAQFRTAWSLPLSVKVVGGNTHNLGRSDEMNIYDSLSALVDRLTYGDQTFPGTIRTNAVSGNPKTLGALGANDPAQWQLSVEGDSYGSYEATTTDVGNPGLFNVVPEPTSVTLAVMAGIALCGLGLKSRGGRRSAM